MAINCNNFPQIGKVIALPSNANLESVLSVEWLQQERNTTKPKWLRFFKKSKGKQPLGTITYSQILLYDFELTSSGALKKKSRVPVKCLEINNICPGLPICTSISEIFSIPCTYQYCILKIVQ